MFIIVHHCLNVVFKDIMEIHCYGGWGLHLLFDYNLQPTALLLINLSQIVSVIMQIPSD